MASRLFWLFHLFLFSPSILSPLFVGETLHTQESDAPLVSAPAGVFHGQVDGGLRAFLGVPYALPPVKERRFQDPIAIPGWSLPLNATVSPPPCLHFDLRLGEVVGEEDCLYLNIFGPESSTSESRLPVLVVFLSGRWSPPPRGPSRLLSEGLLVVTVHFRLQVLGFLATESPKAPGNVGLADQLSALRWIRDNIASFGGDPNAVTALGQGEAATALTLLLFSPASRGLVTRAVIHGGVAFTRLGLDPAPFDSAFQLAKVLECTPLFTFTSADRLLKCFRSRSGAELAREWHGSTHSLTRSMAPTLDVRVPPLVEMDPPAAPGIPLLIGVSPNDGRQRVDDYLSKIDFPSTPESTDHLLRVLFATMFSSEATLNAISSYYLYAKKTEERDYLLPVFSQAVTEFSTYSSSASLARFSANRGPTFLYELTYDQSEAATRATSDLLLHLLLGDDSPDPGITLDDRVMSDIIVTLWASFVKTGIPTIPRIPLPPWEPLPTSPGRDLHYYDLSLDPRPRPSLRPHALAFWASMHALDTGQEGVKKWGGYDGYRLATWVLLTFCLLLTLVGFCFMCPLLRDTTPVQRVLVYLCPHLLSAQQTEV